MNRKVVFYNDQTMKSETHYIGELKNFLIIYQDKNGLGVFKYIYRSETKQEALKEFKRDNTCYDVLAIREVNTDNIMSKKIVI